MAQSTYSLSFDGGSSVVAVPNSASLAAVGAGDWTVAFWLKCSSVSQFDTIFSSYIGSGGQFRLVIFDVDTAHLCIRDQNADPVLTAATAATDGAWHHWAFRRSGASYKIFVDGVLDASTTGSTSSVASDAGRVIGAFNSGGALAPPCSLDDVGDWATALSDADIAGLAAGTTDPATLSPAGLWRLEEGTGTSTVDASVNGNTGALSGGVTWSSDVPPRLGADVVFDKASNSGFVTSASSYSWSHAWSGDFLAVDVGLLGTGTTVTSVTFNGVALSLIVARSTVTSLGRSESWGATLADLGGLAPGSYTIAVTLSGSIASVGMAVSYVLVDQTTPTEGATSNQATNVGATDATVAVTVSTDRSWGHAALVTNDDTTADAFTAGQTSRALISNDFFHLSAADEDTGTPESPGTVTMSYVGIGALKTWAMTGYAIRPVTAVTPPAFVYTETAYDRSYLDRWPVNVLPRD